MMVSDEVSERSRESYALRSWQATCSYLVIHQRTAKFAVRVEWMLPEFKRKLLGYSKSGGSLRPRRNSYGN